MYNFDYYNPTKIIFGKDRMNRLNDFISKDANILVIHNPKASKKYNYLDKILEPLKDYTYFEFTGFKSEPNFETLVKAIKIVKKKKINFLLGIGDNSIMDGTKLIALASSYNGDIQELLSNDKNIKIDTALPIGMIVTTPSSKYEMNCCGSILYHGKKIHIENPLMFPKFSILDPTLTYDISKDLISSSIVDTFVHIMETYLTIPSDNKVQNKMAEGILRTLLEIGKGTLDNPTDYNLRANLIWCSSIGTSKLLKTEFNDTFSSHVIVDEMKALFGLEYGKTLAIVAPSLWHIMKEEKREKLLHYSTYVLNITSGNEEERIDLAISKTKEFFESLGVKTHLSSYGISPRDIKDMLKYLEHHNMHFLVKDKSMTLDITRKILEDSL